MVFVSLYENFGQKPYFLIITFQTSLVSVKPICIHYSDVSIKVPAVHGTAIFNFVCAIGELLTENAADWVLLLK